MNPFDLSGKVAVITGGGSGIGESIAKVFAEAGADVHIIDAHPENAARVCDEIHSEGQSCAYYSANVADQPRMIDIFNEIARKKDRIDIAVANAGISQVGKLEDTTPEDFDRIYEVNVKGVYNTMYAAIAHMKRQRSGVLLNMASTASSIGLPDRFGYSMSKGAVLTMTYSVARDYLQYNIRCNSIGPARIHTPFVDDFIARNYPGKEKEMFEKLSKTQPIGRMGKTEEVAYFALYLCSDKASFVTGTNFPIDGGTLTLST